MGQVVAVGTTGTEYAAMMVGLAIKKAKEKRTKWHCLCMMESGEEVYIAVRAETEEEASVKAHAGYAVEYVLEILTSAELEVRKRELQPDIAAGVAHYY